MNSFRDKLSQFMQGRYGFDRLSRFIFLLSFVFWGLCLIARFTPWHWLYIVFSLLNTLLYIGALFRIFSRDYGFTDEGTIWPIRLGVLLGSFSMIRSDAF